MQTIWLSPTNYVTGDPTLRVSYPFASHPSTIVTCTTPGDFKWVSMGLRLPPNVQIEQVIICYEVSNSCSFISQTRLAEMTTPDHANVVHDDPTHLTSTRPTSYNSAISGLIPTGAVTLELRLNFQHTNDEILLGAVGVILRANSECCVNSIPDLRALGPGASDCLTVLGYDTPGDGGEGEFFWDSSFNVDLNIWPPGEDGGVVIRPSGLQPTQPGRWRRPVEAALSVKWFGAKGDGKPIHDGAMNAGSMQLTSQAGGFTPGDVGKSIGVDGAGAVQDLCTTITHISATEVTLATAASTSVIGASVTCVSWPPNAPTLSDGMMTAGSHLLTITIQSGAFTPSDIGRVLRVAGAGSPGPLHSVIGSFIGPMDVNLQSPATTRVSMATVFWGTDDTDAIQAAEDAASLIKSDVLFPPGTYIINGAKNTIPIDPHRYGIEKKSNTRWFGCGYASSILKLKSNSTSDPTDPQKTVDPQMIYANAKLDDIGFYRLGFDLNGANNTLCAPANVAAIWLNGDNLEVNGMVVEGCKFYNGPGATVILVQNRATSWSGYPLDDVLLQNNRFEDNCLSPVTGDHSTVNIWARRTRVSGNIFRQTAVVPTIQRYTGAIMEFHGADGLFMGNIIDSYGRVVIASENYIEPWENLLVANNIASDLGLWFISTEVGNSQSPLSRPIDKVIVRGNQVAFNADTSQGGLKAGLLQSHKLPICYIEVSDNYFEMVSPSSGIVLVGVTSQQVSPGTSYTEHLKVSGNTFNKMEFGAWVDNLNFIDQVKNLEYVNNTCLNMQDLGLNPEAAGLWVDGSAAQHVENLVVMGNRFINEADNTGYKYGVSLGLHIDSLSLDRNVFYNLKGKDVLQR
jgi:hypothetical protein